MVSKAPRGQTFPSTAKGAKEAPSTTDVLGVSCIPNLYERECNQKKVNVKWGGESRRLRMGGVEGG